MSYSRFFLTALSTCILSNSAMAATASAVAGNSNAPVTRAEFPALLKETLLNNPDILSEVVEKMQSTQQEEDAKKTKEGLVKHKDELFSDPQSPSVGPADADVTMVEFFDYHCGYCKQALGTITRLLESDKKLRVIFKEYPILSEDSRYAAKAALAVNHIAKDKYLDFHKAMFSLSGTITEEVVMREAKKVGIDAAKLKAELANPELDKELAKTKELGAAIGARGTPAIIIGDTLYPGAIPYDTMQKIIADVRSGKKK